MAQIDTNKWTVGIRGFVGRFTNKLLVMIDGRSVYQALGGGVYWEANEVLLEDVDRIEVIRGPGRSLRPPPGVGPHPDAIRVADWRSRG